MKEKIFIFGASGHAKVVIDVIERLGHYEILFLVDDDPDLKGRNIYGYPVLGGRQDLVDHRMLVPSGIVAIGSNSARMNLARWLTENGFLLIRAVHPIAQLARGATVGDGTVVMAGAIVNSDAYIGNNAIINTRASIDHDCALGDGVHIAPGATLCGSVTVGEGTFVCAGATIIPNVTIGRNVVIGAGSTVIRDVSDDLTVVGCPAKIAKQ